MKQRNWKAEAIKQWNADPCGADRVIASATKEYFDRVERERYECYAPWLPRAVQFGRFAGKRVLEIGFGVGTDYLSFTRAGAECFGVDLAQTHIDATRRRLQLESQPVRLVRGDAEDLPFADESVDGIYSFGVLHHTPDIQRSIDEIFRVLRVGGEAIIGLYHRDSAFWFFTVLVRGILRGGLFRVGYRGLMSQIESRVHSDAVPLVKVYSRWEVRRMFSRFRSVHIGVHHLGMSNSGPGALRRFAYRHAAVFARLLGWYLLVIARK